MNPYWRRAWGAVTRRIRRGMHSRVPLAVHKRSGTPWIGEQMPGIVAGQSTDFGLPPYEDLDKAWESAVKRLEGTTRSTSFRHEMLSMDAAQCARGVSSPRNGRTLLWRLVRAVRPRCVLELGSAFGAGSIYIADALARNGAGKLLAVEYEAWRADVAREMVAGLYPGIATFYAGAIEDLVPKLATEADSPVDFCFVDAAHRFEDCMRYHDLLGERVVNGATVVYDDINFNEDMGRFWQTLIQDGSISDAVLAQERWGIVRYGKPSPL